MTPKIKIGRPPNFFKLIKVFPKAVGANTIFAYGDTIYVSTPGIMLTPALIKHERVHLLRQQEMGGPELWWDKYMDITAFRYYEEVLAHRAEYRELIKSEVEKNIKVARLKNVAKRLISPLYKFEVTLSQAMADIAR